MIGEVQGILALSRRKILIITVVRHHRQQATVSGLHSLLRQLHRERKISPQMLLHLPAVQVNYLFAHGCLEMKRHLFSPHILGNHKMFPVPRHSLIVTTTTCLGGHQFHGMRSGYHLPGCIIKLHGFRSFYISAMKTPSGIEIIYYSSASG